MKRLFLASVLGFAAWPSIAAAQNNDGANERALVSAQVGGSTDGATTEDKEWEERDRKMNEAATLTGGVGLIHTQHAQGGAVGQFRVGFSTEYFSGSFLCTSDFPCPNPTTTNSRVTSDDASHFGGRLNLSMQVTKWLEPYLATSAFANSNNANRPSLLQVLGDSTLGAKVHGSFGKIFSVGGAYELWLVNGTGSVGLDGGGTGSKFRGLATADLRGKDKPIPLRFSINGTYTLDNTGTVVEDTEKARGTSITRIERYGLGINRVDHFDFNLGAELFAAQERVRPFIEYSIEIPVNRQGYECRPNNPSGDKCLANNAIAPSSLTIGSRFYPWKRGFSVLLGLDIGLTGVGDFIEEVKPTPPWMLYLGLGWAFDTRDRPPVIQEKIVEKPMLVKAPGRKIKGFVHEENVSVGIAGAIVSFDNHPELTSLATGGDGRFLTQGLDEGPYIFGIKADGFKPAQCTTTIVRPAGQSPTDPPGGDIQLDCPVQSLPKVGAIVGHVKDLDGGAAVANASVSILDAQKKSLTATSDASGNFRLEALSPGMATVTTDAGDYLASTETLDVKPRTDNALDINLKKRPKNANVTVGKTEITIKQQIQFALDSATILPESTGLLTEIADALIKNPRIKKVEVQGHTDNTGTPDHNNTLSQDRANAVTNWLTAHGVAADRMTAKGFGQNKPLVPNVTAGNRARNRRVQFIITDQDPATPAASTTPKK